MSVVSIPPEHDMRIIQRVHNVARAFLQRYGTAHMKSALWNREFATGRWKCLDSTPGDCIYTVLEKYARQGSILDLGCGSGSTAAELAATAYTTYMGVDISDVAIRQAVRRTTAVRREAKNRFAQAEFFTFTPTRKYDIILFRDSIYYVPLHHISALLKRYSAFLRDGGVFVVRLWGSEHNPRIVETIQKTFTTLETFTQDDPRAIILVFR